MKPSRRVPRPPRPQLLLPLDAARVAALDAAGRARVIAVLARLLLEATRPLQTREATDETP